MEKRQNNLKINVDPILEQFECLVWMNHFRTPHITKWGHSFCQDCIFECLNLKKQCPHCNEACHPEDVIRNYQLEDILNQLNEAKKAESEKYFDNIANNNDNGEEGVMNKSPIETVSTFQQNSAGFPTYMVIPELNTVYRYSCSTSERGFSSTRSTTNLY